MAGARESAQVLQTGVQFVQVLGGRALPGLHLLVEAGGCPDGALLWAVSRFFQ